MQEELYGVEVHDRRMQDEYMEIVWANSLYEAFCIVDADLKKWQRITHVKKISEKENKKDE